MKQQWNWFVVFVVFFGSAMLAFADGGKFPTIPDSKAKPGGNVNLMLQAEPTTLHPIKSSDAYASTIQSYVMDRMAFRNLNTLEWEPRIAEKWEVSKNKLEFTFWLKKNVVFHDGKPLTAEDVKFSVEAVFDPKYEAAHLIPYYESISKIDIIDPYTIKFHFKDTYFKNFETVASMDILPKHIYSDVEKSNKMNKELVGAGPYVLEKYDRGQKIVLKRFEKWHGLNIPLLKAETNFDTVSFRFVTEENVRLEMVKKGDIDYEVLTSEQVHQKLTGEPWGTKIPIVKTDNGSPKWYNYIGLNLKNQIFSDKNTRKALGYLMNREEMNKKFAFGEDALVPGPGDTGSDYFPKDVKPILFDPKKAKDLLTKAGWKDEDKNGILEKTIDGKKVEFKFTLTYARKEIEKYLTFYKEDLKRAGIEMELKVLEWNAFIKNLQEKKHEAVCLRWTGQLDWDFKQIWHSSSAAEGGSNYGSYSNKEVDKLIEESRIELDRKKRTVLVQKAYRMIADDMPYIWMFHPKPTYYAYQKRIGRPGDTLKYDIGDTYWWISP